MRSCLNFVENYRREPDGRYVVGLTFIDSGRPLGSSRQFVHTRYNRLKKRRGANGEAAAYSSVMNEYFELGHAERVAPSEVNKPDAEVFYMPHHAVMKESSTTTKLRVVFDCSAKT